MDKASIHTNHVEGVAPRAPLGFRAWILSVWHVEPDELHVMYLGTVMYVWGSVLWLLCFVILPDTPQKNMETVWAGIRE